MDFKVEATEHIFSIHWLKKVLIYGNTKPSSQVINDAAAKTAQRDGHCDLILRLPLNPLVNDS